MSHTWGRPASHQDRGWAVIDVETSGFRPGQARIISLAVLGLDAAGRLEQSVVSLLNPKVDPGPTHVHGLTAAMLDDQPQFADIAGEVVDVLRGRTLVAHNVAFDYAFLAAEAEIAEAELPVDFVMCTVAARMACPYLNPGRYVQGRPLVQGMRVGLAAEVKRTHEELVERILHAGLAYSDVVDRDTSLVVCNATAPEHGKGYHALQLGVPVMPEARFMECIGAVVGGASVEDFTDVAPVEKQLALF